jgi:hypothetical protein
MHIQEHRNPFRTFFIFGMTVYAVSFYGMINHFRVVKNFFREGFGSNFLWPTNGFDFSYLYKIATEVRSGEPAISGYPPLVGVTIIPFTFLPEHAGYIAFTFLSAVLLFLIVFLCLRENHLFDTAQEGLFIALLCAGLFYHTYPFLFLIERGQFDILPAFCAAAGLFALSRNFKKTAIVLLVMAMQYKIYPLVLACILIVRYGWTVIVPLAALNIVLIFGRGLVVGVGCLDWLLHRGGVNPMNWPGNHCLVSFAHEMVRLGNLSTEQEPVFAKVSILATIAVFMLVFFWVVSQLMSLVMGYSHDYRLPIQIIPFLLMITRDKADFPCPEPLTYGLLAVLAMSVAFLFLPFFLIKTFGILVSFIVYAIFAVYPVNRAGVKA